MENKEQELLNIPDMPEDAIAFIAQNPNDEMELPSIHYRSKRIYRKTIPGPGKRCWKMAKPIHEKFKNRPNPKLLGVGQRLADCVTNWS